MPPSLVEAQPKNAAAVLSVIVPVHNEAENVPPLMEELQSAFEALNEDYEILWINDGSNDRTGPLLDGLAHEESPCRVLHHDRRFGQSASHATGFHYARGNRLVTMDGDGQNDPADLPELVSALENDVACVTGIRVNRQDRWTRRVSSSIANAFRNWITGDRITDAGCTFRLFKKEGVREIPLFDGMHRFLPTLLRAQGFRVIEMPIHHRPRRHGTSKYGVSDRLWRGIVDCAAMRWYQRRALPAQRVNTLSACADPFLSETP